MGVHGDTVTHTSDYFDQLYELCVKLIKDGKAYADDTEQEQVRLLPFSQLLVALTPIVDAEGAF